MPVTGEYPEAWTEQLKTLNVMQARFEWRKHNIETDFDLIDKEHWLEYIQKLHTFLKLKRMEILENART